MSGKGLDRRLSEAFLHLLERNAPRWTHQEEVYQYVEREVQLTERQMSLHVQKAGQIEPNWQHDLRNLQHTLKRNGTVINPERELWALPVEKVEIRDVLRHWHECVLAVTGSTGNVTSLTTPSGQTIERQLFVERIHHLLQCGGLLPRGRMHNWSRIERALFEISPRLEIMYDWIVWAPNFDEIGREGFYGVVEVVKQRVKDANDRGAAATGSRQREGKERRTVSREVLPAIVPDSSTSRIAYLLDRNGRRIDLDTEGLRYNIAGARARGYHCPKCGFESYAVRGPYVGDHFKHNRGAKDDLRASECPCKKPIS